ncbi:MAG: type II toxin-antitoxin system RelE/ParE family toxin [Acidobacteria bacterium]|nr:type II toxin-antitoxin system RelE/ParE family toxin [Acidobacteriota bacterium]MBI3658712.1 type II toxin-antitoxin system RelE/ParE family toxin [Acidobacteriota bacterium]
MNIRILSCAEQEFAETVDYYNEQCPGLGYEFAAEVKNTLERIVSFPDAWPSFSGRTRRCMISRFPYGILYQVRQDLILVAAMMHLRRDPNSWQGRIKKTFG